MKIGSLFDGIGGFPYSAQRHGITPVWASEIEPSCVSITKRHFHGMKHLGDITKINGAEIKPVDIISFGSPCQDLSVAGKRAGLDGERSGLFGEAIRIIDEMRSKTNAEYPRFAIWENVPGALSSNNGLDFKAVLQSFAGCEIPMPDSGRWATAGMVRGGRCDIAWRVLDAQYWGVPQRRRRIFLVADFSGKCATEILFKPESLRGDFAPSEEARQETAGRAENGVEDANDIILFEPRSQDGVHRLHDKVCPTLNTAQGGQRQPCVAVFNDVKNTTVIRMRSGCGGGGKGALISKDRSLTLKGHNDQTLCIQNTGIGRTGNNGPGGKGLQKGVSYTLDTKEPHAVVTASGFMAGQSEKAGGLGYQYEVSPTLRASASGTNQAPSVLCVADTQADATINSDLCPTLNCMHEQPYIAGNGYAVRRLTPVECERLQGLPDNWTALSHDGNGISDTKRYAAIGNSVAIPCVDYIMSGIIDVTPKAGK